MDIVLVAAVAKNGVIGNRGKIPWRISEDIKRFREITMWHPVLMGRATYFSIREKYRPLEGRLNVVLTSNRRCRDAIDSEGATSACSLDEAFWAAGGSQQNKIYVIGGQRVYEQTIELASGLELTEIDREYEGDALFPKINRDLWVESSKDKREGFSFVRYNRK